MVSLLKSARAVGLAALMMLAAVMGGTLVSHALPSPDPDDVPTRLGPDAVSSFQAAPMVSQPEEMSSGAGHASASADGYGRAAIDGRP
ncbi:MULTISPECIES: hypothetical protein [Inquilinus]|uniref:Uncharacterized protein n=1 Tax=Inquilinus ginsengisoli TaxID=363840 RepID=A0ABU1JN42_9PROT|nr:hypothetical protein [Inquilinus ginsengisoli]MDR6290034.1 hypothetical protein [Inquilinus ginsengisoli]